MSDPHYRRLWRQHIKRDHTALSQAAVAKVIEEYLWESGERSENSTGLARQMKDRVSRALKGDSLSAETLKWFIAAFEMDEEDERRLWDVFAGKEFDIAGISNTLRRHRKMIRRQCHRTVSLVERYFIDRHGSLTLRRTHHTIRAIEDGVDIYIFNHEPQASDIEVVHGGNLGRHYEYGGGLTSAEIVLDKPLRKAESTVLEYHTRFAPNTATLTEIRRAAFARCENVDIAVEFERFKIPKNAWWCAWDDHIAGELVVESPAEIHKCIIRRFVPYIQETVVGFRWEW
ncbi:MAG TPA: hypothetical protein VFU43_22515 [Streptosporangiaceae bacterium]|nr:hypothetical protein [Streptosporangiaceae bacterium]